MKTTHLILGGLGLVAVAGFALTRPPATEPVSHSTPAEPSQEGNGGMPPGHPPTEGMPPGHPPTGNMPPGHPPTDTAGLPPGHPPMGAGEAGALPPGKFADDETLSWKKPEKWKEIPNPSSMRVATYRLPGSEEAECSVVRAGGTADANIDRWIGQFDESGHSTAKRSQTKVSGFTVSRLDIQGTYKSGGMGGPSGEKKGWAMTGLVVETPGGTYFFKITGPEAAVKGAAKDVDALVASFAQPK